MHISIVSYNIHGHVICIYILYFVCCDNIYQEMDAVMHISMVSYNIHGHVICIYILYFVCWDNIYQEMQ